MEIMKIKCPNCSAIMTVKVHTGMENIMMKCPVCQEKAPFSSYKKETKDKDDSTEYASDNTTIPMTELGDDIKFIIGELTILDSHLDPFKLKPGRNIIGRKANSSKADIQIPLKDNQLHISREHLIIDVKRVDKIGYIHNISLYKDKVNDTFINDEKICYLDSLRLTHGDIIKLPDNVNLMFIIPDKEGTTI